MLHLSKISLGERVLPLAQKKARIIRLLARVGETNLVQAAEPHLARSTAERKTKGPAL